MKTVILAGGLGTRISEETHVRPKPMVEIGGLPILWHIMKIYAHFGHRDFIVCLGYKGEVIKEWFSDFRRRQSDVTHNLETESVTYHSRSHEPREVTLLDTGAYTLTGGRIVRIRHQVGDGRFFLTYGDGVGDINIPDLLAYHIAHGKVATMTTTIPDGRFGVVKVREGSLIHSFNEKVDNTDRINAGFFVFEPEIFDYLKGGDTEALEQGPLQRLAAEGQLVSYPHDGFWHPMDTLSDKRKLEDLWATGAPWKFWDR